MQKQEQAAEGMGTTALLVFHSSDDLIVALSKGEVTLGTKEHGPWKCSLFRAWGSFTLVRCLVGEGMTCNRAGLATF